MINKVIFVSNNTHKKIKNLKYIWTILNPNSLIPTLNEHNYYINQIITMSEKDLLILHKELINI